MLALIRNKILYMLDVKQPKLRQFFSTFIDVMKAKVERKNIQLTSMANKIERAQLDKGVD